MVKQQLKAAKQALEANDPDTALYYAKEVLEEDPKNYFAQIFQGKSYQLLGKNNMATNSYKKAIDLDHDNLLGWKGLFQVVRSAKPVETKRVFEVAEELSQIQQSQGVSPADTLKDLKNFLDVIGYKQEPVVFREFCDATAPGTPFGDIVGTSLGTREANLAHLINLVQKPVDDAAAKSAMKKTALTLDQQAKADRDIYDEYQQSGVGEMYEQFLNICDDDEKRVEYKERQLKYTLSLLKCAPDKPTVYQKVHDMIEDMVMLRVPSKFAWDLYFNWSDFPVLSAATIPVENIIWFLQRYPEDPVAIMLYAFVLSDYSDFDRKRIVNETGGAMGLIDDKVDEEEEGIVDEEREFVDEQHVQDKYSLLPDQVLGLMVDGYKKATKSIFAHRLLCNFYLHIREYSDAQVRCRQSVQLLAQIQRTYGMDTMLPHTKTDFLRMLAIVYTYYEAPKNFNRALQLYDSILATNPDDVHSKVGKGVIFMENNKFQEAQRLFSEVVSQFPDNNEAVNELGWAEVCLGNYKEGRNWLQQAIKSTPGTDVASGNFRSVCRWRLAKSYTEEDPKQAHAIAVAALKDNPNYAPVYTLLGELYATVFGDVGRANKCFYKAIELDSSEVVASKYLVMDMMASDEWEVAEILCGKVIEGESSRRLLNSVTNTDPDRDWPWRVLGVIRLNHQDDAKAIEYFQSALRVCPEDSTCWLGLGEAYYHCGKLEAAAKVFTHCFDKFGGDWHAHYMMGRVQCDVGEFSKGLEHLLSALEEKPRDECILAGIYEAYSGQTSQLLASGYVGRALASNDLTLDYLVQFHNVNPESQSFWKSISECLRVYLSIQKKSIIPKEKLRQLFSDVEPEGEISWASAEGKAGTDLVGFIVDLLILAGIEGVRRLGPRANKYLRSAAFYNIGIAYGEGIEYNPQYSDVAISYLKKAIAIEGNNPAYWVGLGNCYFGTYPQIAQHCYIKASTQSSYDASVWINLASLYLKYGDDELAQQAFTRAQSMAPTNAMSWLGNAMVNQARGERAQAYHFFSHAYIIANGKVPIAQVLFGASALAKYQKGADPHNITTSQELSLANFAMHKYLQYFPNDHQGQRIATNIGERCMEYKWSREVSDSQVAEFEAAYEKDESEENLLGFARAKAQWARVVLGQREYENGLEAANMVLSLVEGADRTIELSCRVTAGLCHYFLGDFDASLAQLQAILEADPSSQRLVVLVAQILYSFDNEDTKQAALDQLLGYIEEYGASPMVVLVLASMSLRDDLTNYMAPIRDELIKIDLTDIISDITQVIPDMIAAISEKLGISNATGWQRQVLLTPWNYRSWSKLDNVTALSVAELRDNKVRTHELAKAYYDTGKKRLIQRSSLLRPEEYYNGVVSL